jgi:hypothetical protein
MISLKAYIACSDDDEEDDDRVDPNTLSNLAVMVVKPLLVFCISLIFTRIIHYSATS